MTIPNENISRLKQRDNEVREVAVPPRSVAIVSGKGGSGKTMIAAMMAEIVDVFSPVALIDADTGTGGLSYYLGLKLARNVAVGLADLALDIEDSSSIDAVQRMFQPLGLPFNETVFLSVGNHRRLADDVPPARVADVISSVINVLREVAAGWIFIDCRGGIDSESIAVCKSVDDIILIVEPDITSFQATQHVVEILTARGLGRKLQGFIINKVFEDPTAIVRNGTAVFKCQCLAAVPFDLDATRDFLVGNVPEYITQFGVQIWSGLRKAYPLTIRPGPGRVWDYSEFSQVSLSNIEGSRGGLTCSGLILLLTLTYFLQVAGEFGKPYANEKILTTVYIVSSGTLGILGSIERLRRAIGRLVGRYIRAISLMFRGKRTRY